MLPEYAYRHRLRLPSVAPGQPSTHLGLTGRRSWPATVMPRLLPSRWQIARRTLKEEGVEEAELGLGNGHGLLNRLLNGLRQHRFWLRGGQL